MNIFHFSFFLIIDIVNFHIWTSNISIFLHSFCIFFMTFSPNRPQFYVWRGCLNCKENYKWAWSMRNGNGSLWVEGRKPTKCWFDKKKSCKWNRPGINYPHKTKRHMRCNNDIASHCVSQLNIICLLATIQAFTSYNLVHRFIFYMKEK